MPGAFVHEWIKLVQAVYIDAVLAFGALQRPFAAGCFALRQAAPECIWGDGLAGTR